MAKQAYEKLWSLELNLKNSLHCQGILLWQSLA